MFDIPEEMEVIYNNSLLDDMCSPHTTMASQDDSENLVANAIGSMAYSYIVNSLSVGLCYGRLNSTWYYSPEHISLGISICLFYASFHVLRLVLSP